ncbi:universal stress protein, partial [Streptomyces sp. Da 82-17]|uniref:universal stress protein n=1 Tax=Streptomyces sp. Da 82-17 TaxID=3377116 RepID=UPI0038D4379E
GRPGDIVVGVDIRQLCDPLLEFAFGEAARLGCRVRAVHAWTLPPVVREASALVAAEQDLAPGVQRGLAAILAHWERQYPSVPVVALAPVGPAAPVLVRAAAGAELVVVGRRSRRPTLGAHIGPVTHAVVHHCAAPVAVVSHR